MAVLDFLVEHRDAWLTGITVTLRLAFLSFFLALAVGVLIASFRVSPVPPLRRFATLYVSVFRNTPLLVVFFLFFFGLPKVGVQFPPFETAVVVLTLYTGAYLGEAVRSGINAVATGQVEAARALGLGFVQVLALVVIPQALRTVVAPIGNLFVANFKNTSVAFTISVIELTGAAFRLNNRFAAAVPAFLGAAFIYAVFLIPSGAVFGAIERRVAIRR